MTIYLTMGKADCVYSPNSKFSVVEVSLQSRVLRLQKLSNVMTAF